MASKEKELELKQIGQNIDACKLGIKQPHKGVTRWYPDTGTSFILSQPEGAEKTVITGLLERTGVEVPKLEEDRRRLGIIVRLLNLDLRMKIPSLAQPNITPGR